MVWHFPKIFEGYITLAVAPLPRHYLSKDPDQGPGRRRRASGRTRSPSCRSAARSSSTRSPRAASCASSRTRTTRARRPASRPTSTRLIWKWYGDADAMIAGYKAGEVDFATDLQDSDIPKVQDLGDQVSAAPGPPVRVPPPELVGRRTCSKNPTRRQDRGTGCPMSDPAMREAISFAIDKNEINTRLLGGTVQVANTNISPGAWFFADQPPATFDPDEGQVDPRRGRLGAGRRRHPRRRTACGPRSSSAPRPARSARTRSR